MSSLIANQTKTNMCSVSLKETLYCLHYLCATLLADTTILTTITACTIHLFAILLTTATTLLEVHSQLVTRLLELQLTD